MACFCCKPACDECFPDLWMAKVNADFEANHEQDCRDYDEAEAVPIDAARLEQMVQHCLKSIDEAEEARSARKSIIEGN